MKNRIIVFVALLATMLFSSCYSNLSLRVKNYFQGMPAKKVNKIVAKAHRETDTVYVYSISYVKLSKRMQTGRSGTWYSVWYTKADTMHSFDVYPYRIEKQDPITIKNIPLNDSIERYLVGFPSGEEYRCFWQTLDGEGIDVYVIGRDRPLAGSIDTECLFSRTYPMGSFPYQLQYHLSRMQEWRYADFEKLYPENRE